MVTQSIDKVEKNHSSIQTIDDIVAQNSHIPAMLVLSEDGMIVDANGEGRKLLDFSPEQTNEQHISSVILELIKFELLEKNEKRVNTYLRFLSRIGYKFKLCSLNGKKFFSDLVFSDIVLYGRHRVVVMIYPASAEGN